MGELVFNAPDAGCWEQDGTHFPRPMTLFLQEAFRDGFIKGFQTGTKCYGLLLDHIEPAFVNSFFITKPSSSVRRRMPRNRRPSLFSN